MRRSQDQCLNNASAFYRGICKKGSLQLQASSRQRWEIASCKTRNPQKYDEAVKRFNDNKAQAKAKLAPRGGVGASASMIVLEPEAEGSKIVADTVVPVSDEYYAMMDSGTNAIIVPLRPDMSGEIAECKVPSATIEGPIVQVLNHRDDEDWLSLSLSQPSLSLSSAGWTIIAECKDGVSQIKVYTSTGGSPKTLSMKNGLPSCLGGSSGSHGRHCEANYPSVGT